jgi:hypothetical protein
MPFVNRRACKCSRCGYEWLPHSSMSPIACARCKSSYWNSNRKLQRRQKIISKISLSNIENKDKNTIYIDLPKDNVQQYAENVIKKNKPLFDKLAIS